MPTAGLKTIIALSFVLAVGFLLVILSCAIFHNYHPLLVVATYVLAPAPNWICGRCANPDDFVESSGAAVLDLGRFFTGFFVLMGMGKFFLGPRYARFVFLASLDLGIILTPRCARFAFLLGTLRPMLSSACECDSCKSISCPMLTFAALPVVLAHSGIIQIEAMIMSVAGGLLIYGTIISFGLFFQEDQEF